MGVVGRSTACGFAVGFIGSAALIVALYATGDLAPRALHVGAIVAVGFGVVGGVPTALAGLLVGFIRRASRRYSTVPPPVDLWAEPVERCAESTRRVTAAILVMPRSPARDRLYSIADRMARELDDVRGVAQLGRSLGAVDREHPVYQRLRATALDFAAFEHQVYMATLSVRDDPTHDVAHLERRVARLSG